MDLICTREKRFIPAVFLSAILVLILCSTGAVGAEESVHQKFVNGFIQWITHNSDEETGLPVSHVGDDRFANRTSTYDASVVILAYIASGRIHEAERIVKYYLETPAVWRLGGIIESVNPNSARLGEDWSVRTGANLWFGMAAFHLYKKTGKVEYMALSRKLADLGISLQIRDKRHVNYGGVSLGPPGAPDIPTDQHFGYDPANPSLNDVFPTEGNLDAYALFNMLFLETREKRYEEARDAVLVWLKARVYDRKAHRFLRGFEDETIATDVQSWGVSALGMDVLETFENGSAEKIIAFVEENCVSEVFYQKPDGQRIRVTGADFIDRRQARILGREPIVSPEWTFQLINAYLRLGDEYEEKGENQKALNYEKRRKTLLASMLSMATPTEGGLSYPYASEANAVIGHEYSTPEPGNLSVIGAAYGVLALEKYDPLNAEVLFKKNQP